VGYRWVASPPAQDFKFNGPSRPSDQERRRHAIRAHAGNNLEKAAAAIFGRSGFGLAPQDLRF
jgi:hypothetical protein